MAKISEDFVFTISGKNIKCNLEDGDHVTVEQKKVEKKFSKS